MWVGDYHASNICQLIVFIVYCIRVIIIICLSIYLTENKSLYTEIPKARLYLVLANPQLAGQVETDGQIAYISTYKLTNTYLKRFIHLIIYQTSKYRMKDRIYHSINQNTIDAPLDQSQEGKIPTTSNLLERPSGQLVSRTGATIVAPEQE